MTRVTKVVIEKVSPLVTVADGEKTISQNKCLGFSREMQGSSFFINTKLLRLGGYDMILVWIG